MVILALFMVQSEQGKPTAIDIHAIVSIKLLWCFFILMTSPILHL